MFLTWSFNEGTICKFIYAVRVCFYFFEALSKSVNTICNVIHYGYVYKTGFHLSGVLQILHQNITQAPLGLLEMMLVITIVSPCWFLALQMYFPKSLVSMSSTVIMLWETLVVWPMPLLTSLQEVWIWTGRWS